MAIILDDLDTPNTDIPFSPHHQPIGFTYHCPRCGSNRTYYSSLEQDWVCIECRLVFKLEEVYFPCHQTEEEEYEIVEHYVSPPTGG